MILSSKIYFKITGVARCAVPFMHPKFKRKLLSAYEIRVVHRISKIDEHERFMMIKLANKETIDVNHPNNFIKYI